MSSIKTKLTKREERFFNVAKSAAKTSDFHGVKVGCVVCYGNVILSVASNSEKSHTLQYIYNNRFRNFNANNSINKLHAEIHALSLIYRKPIDWSHVELYVYRELKNGKPVISRPCIACENFIKDLGIKTIFYINKNGNFVKEKLYV